MTSRLLLFVFILLSAPAFAQTFSLTGRVVDSKDATGLVNVSVALSGGSDSSNVNGTVSDEDGDFTIEHIAPGKYNLKLNYIGYGVISRKVEISNGNVDLGNIKMTSTAKELKSVTVEGKQERAKQLGDTSQFNADAYKTHRDATAEDLVTKMPGITSDNNGVKVNGEALKQVYVDGKPFFGTDPTLALKNLPSEIIDKIQVFDKLSDQSSFTGFDDGNSEKTMNITTKGAKREGVFGKIYAGYGTDNTYQAGASLNVFHGDQRFTLIGLSNNINQQNFSAQDILGVIGNNSGRNRGGFGGGGGGNFGGGGGGGGNNFFVGQQNGITTTNSLGFNYSGNWGKKLKVSGSYFFNGTDNENTTEIARDYYTNIHYHENDTSEVRNYNHRVNLRFEYTIDSFNTVIFTPGVSLQENNTSTSQYATSDSVTHFLSGTSNFNGLKNTGYSSNDNLLFQHKFHKQRRTISLNINTSLNEKTGTGSYYADNQYTTFSKISDQHNTLYNNGYTVSPNVTYTEPVGKKGQLMASYNPSWSHNSADKETSDKSDLTHDYTNFDTALSNKYNNDYVTQRGGLSYRLGDKKLNFMIGSNVQYATLSGEQTFPYTQTVTRDFTSVLPTAMFNYRYADGRNLRMMYRTNTQAPSVTQLQNVVDISNPLLLKTGNPLLKQDYEHTFIVRYGLTKSKTSRNFFMNLYANYIDNYIGNATYQPLLGDTLYKNGSMLNPVRINRGSQLTLPVNLNGYFTERAFITYSMPMGKLKSNLNLSGGFNFTHTPGQINNVINYADNYIPSGGLVISSNISEKLDFTLSYQANYNIVNNSVQSAANNNYYNHTAGFKINYILLKNIVLNTNITHNYYTAFSSTGDQSYFLWNAYVGYKLLKNQALEARITAFDLLNQNKSITRTVTETYIENDVTKVLKQYFMFQLTYTIRKFKGMIAPDMNGKPNEDRMMMHGHGGMPGGPNFEEHR